jgi:hypothetical protein
MQTSGAFDMEVHFTPDQETELREMAATTGRAPAELIQDAMAGYFDELRHMRSVLDSRYDDVKGGHVEPVDGKEAFKRIRQRSEARRATRS